MSLFNAIATDSDEVTTPSTPEIETDSLENTGEIIERPNWLPEKFKTAEDFAKSYGELEKRLTSVTNAAPKEYNFEAGEGWIDADYEPFHEMAEFAKSKHVPQDVMDSMLSTVGKYLNEFNSDIAEEKAKLGENAKERLEVLNNWAKSNFSEDSYNALTGNMRTADAIQALEEVRSKMLSNTTTIPTGNENAGGDDLTLESVQQELHDNFDKYKNDAGWRAKFQQKLERVANKSGYVDKHF